MLMKFKKFQNKIFVHMKTFDVTIFHILVHFIGSKVGLYVSFLICLYVLCLRRVSVHDLGQMRPLLNISSFAQSLGQPKPGLRSLYRIGSL